MPEPKAATPPPVPPPALLAPPSPTAPVNLFRIKLAIAKEAKIIINPITG